MMFKKTYQPDTILRKKAKRPFPKEVLKEAKEGDLFTALYSKNIKSIKHKVINKNHKDDAKNGVKKRVTNLEDVQEENEIFNCDDSMDPFDVLMKEKSSQGLHCNVTNKSMKTIKRVEVNKENCGMLGNHRTNTEREQKYFNAKDKSLLKGRKNDNKSSEKCSRKNMPELEDSYFNMLESSGDLRVLTDEFISGKINIKGKKKELRKNSTMKPPIFEEIKFSPLQTKSESHSFNQTPNNGFFTMMKTRKMCTKPANSTPAKHVKHIPHCLLSPITPFIAETEGKCSDSVEKQNKENKSSPDSELSSTIENLRTLHLDSEPESFKERYTGSDYTIIGNNRIERNEFEGISEKSLINRELVTANSAVELSNNYYSQIISQDSKREKFTKRKRAISQWEKMTTPNVKNSINHESHRRKTFNSFNTLAFRRSHVVIPLMNPGNQKTSLFHDAYINCVSPSCLHITDDFHRTDNSGLAGSIKGNESTFKDLVLQHCEQTEPYNFCEAFPEKELLDCKKIGEGVYGEVFSHLHSSGVPTIIKIMPIEGSCNINDERQKSFEEILPEIVITKELSNLRNNDIFGTTNFPELVTCWCVQGRYPSKLLELWHEFDEKIGSENDSPEILQDDQMYIVLELSNVGSAMETFTFSSAAQCLSVFKQATCTLATAEAALEFEHRDLHWGNLLIKRTKAKNISWKLYGEEFVVKTHGIQASIIDFTLSRITYDNCSVYNNLADDPALFEGQGDYQFEIYRLMRDKTKNNWEKFEPYTNVLWLSYVLEKLINTLQQKHYSKKKIDRDNMIKLQHYQEKILDFKSATDAAISICTSSC